MGNNKTTICRLGSLVRHALNSQSLRVAGYVPRHAAQPLAVAVHRGPGTGALRRAGLAVRPAGQQQHQGGQQQQSQERGRGAARAGGARSSHHHHCGRPTQQDPNPGEQDAVIPRKNKTVSSFFFLRLG